jgi:hypothetical protein
VYNWHHLPDSDPVGISIGLNYESNPHFRGEGKKCLLQKTFIHVVTPDNGELLIV